MSEITPGIARLINFLTLEGFVTTDSGDGVTNVALQMECAQPAPNVFFDVPKHEAFAESERLLELLTDKGVDFNHPESGGPILGFSYTPADGGITMFLMGVDDEMIWGQDPELPRKRLEYQIRYCDEWIADPPGEKMLEAGQTEAEVEEAKTAYAEMRQRFVAELEAL